jgi:hypothetical protein
LGFPPLSRYPISSSVCLLANHEDNAERQSECHCNKAIDLQRYLFHQSPFIRQKRHEHQVSHIKCSEVMKLIPDTCCQIVSYSIYTIIDCTRRVMSSRLLPRCRCGGCCTCICMYRILITSSTRVLSACGASPPAQDEGRGDSSQGRSGDDHPPSPSPKHIVGDQPIIPLPQWTLCS